ncbi:MAG TPA: DUF3466 family protein [Candidatus Limnocylindria bacterium]|jgi:probable HAF family extracellular repeat protein|nr:DUF3466 family protein [Candidatus Limnocylindria bacterium]
MTSLHLNNSDHLVGIADVYFPVGYSNPSHDGIPDIKVVRTGERIMAANINDHDLVLAVGFSSPNFVLTDVGGHLYGGYDYFHALNNAGIAVGSVTPQSSTEAAVARACLASSNVVTRIDTRTPPQLAQNIGWSDALAINNQGHIVGQWVDDGTNKPSRAFVYKGNGVEDLGVLSGTNSVALDINDSDSIVGYFTCAPGTTRACLWFQGVGADLNTLLPENSGWVLLKANAINNQGQIAGDGLYHGQPHGFMLSPGIDVRMSLIPADNGSYTLTFTGQSGGQYRLDFANSLAGTDPWTPLTTLTLSGPSGSYTDSTTNAVAARYYRAVQVP